MIVGAAVYPKPIVAAVPVAQESVCVLNPTAVTIPVIESIVAIPTATCVGASCPDVVVIATVGAVVYALPVVLNAIDDGLIEDPAIPIVAVAPELTGAENVTVGALV